MTTQAYHDTELKIRIQSNIKEQAETAVANHPGKYSSLSHFVRAAMIKELRETKK